MSNKGTDQWDDQMLVVRLKDLDKQAFEQLYHRYAQKLFYYALKFVKSPEMAEDIVHDVFVKVWDNLNDLNPDFSIQAYLYRITHNSLLNLLKRGTVESRIVKEMLQHAEQTTPNTDQAFQYKEALQQTKQAIATLPPKRKQIYELSRYDGLSHRQIAITLNIADSTVNNQMVKAIKSIRDFLSLRGTIG
ncbi:RNA polymerase sigma-70 factor [Pedobacter sp. MC2016-14]|uniref:RNA polymerase sigma-70 factor n=1 Tax=Pedobacter sp. MC2016-14 TaxID=2897327 RepID=UPI001E293B31|nr:RNA polymerase sigma-70 factor [Pedobacter sp. MC2016-14]MCD0487932.1 RNA polymerase sigma-70 factor [Pedobacter sp. MC2016-14]